MDLTTATPAEIDTKLSELSLKRREAQGRIARSRDDIHRYAGDKGRQVSRNRKQYNLTDAQAEAKTREIIASGIIDLHYGTNPQRTIAAIDKAREVIAQVHAEAEPLEAEYLRRPWSRFFLVTSSAGHIHSSQDCSTCNSRTEYGWYPEFSGQTMAEAIAAWDERGTSEILCTVCFPDAPVARTQKPVEDGLCPGSGTYNYPRETARLGYYSGNYGECSHCDQRITVTSTGKMRKHKTAA